MKAKIAFMLKSIIMVTAIISLAVFALSIINGITAPVIMERENKKFYQAVTSVMPGFDIIERDGHAMVNGRDLYYITGEKKEDVISHRAYAVTAECMGPRGPISAVAGIDENGIILGVSIIRHSESPGPGSRIDEVEKFHSFHDRFFENSEMYGDAAPWFQEQFRGLDTKKRIRIVRSSEWRAGDIAFRKELIERNSITAIRGADAVTIAVRDGIQSTALRLRKALKKEQAK
jgi:Na+-translocating ferredoxin:NAD+ oxidoreductase subunit G